MTSEWEGENALSVETAKVKAMIYDIKCEVRAGRFHMTKGVNTVNLTVTDGKVSRISYNRGVTFLRGE